MATTKIWKIEKRLDHVVDYAKDKKKTKNDYLENGFDKYEVLEYFNVREFDKEDYNLNKNIIVLGGCRTPDSEMRKYQKALNDLENSIDIEDKFKSDFEFIDLESEKQHTQSIPKSKTIDRQSLRDMIDDDNLWD